MAPRLVLQIKFYWDTAVPAVCVLSGSSCPSMAELSHMTEAVVHRAEYVFFGLYQKVFADFRGRARSKLVALAKVK